MCLLIKQHDPMNKGSTKKGALKTSYVELMSIVTDTLGCPFGTFDGFRRKTWRTLFNKLSTNDEIVVTNSCDNPQ